MTLAREFYRENNPKDPSKAIEEKPIKSAPEEQTIVISEGCPKKLRDFVAENRGKGLRIQHSDGTFSKGFIITGNPKKNTEGKWSVSLRGAKNGQLYEITIPIEELINTQGLN